MLFFKPVESNRSLRSLLSRLIRVRTFNMPVYLFSTALIASILADHRVGQFGNGSFSKCKFGPSINTSIYEVENFGYYAKESNAYCR